MFYRIICARMAVLLFLTGTPVWNGCSQVSGQSKESSKLVLSGFLDTYAAQDFQNPYTSTRPYTTQALYEDEPRVNLAFLDAKLTADAYRGRLAMQAGDSVKSNYAAEEDRFARYFQEANLGVKLTDRLWLDGGIYLSHIGFESFNSRDNWNYTRSLVADYSPYYETGGKLSYQISDTLTGQLHFLRGWQNISSSSEPGYGVQLQYTPNAATQFTYANYLGDQNGGFRNFHDFIVKRSITDDWSVATQIDFGTQGREDNDRATWYGFAILTQYKVTQSLAVGGRVERYHDPHQVLLGTLSGNSYNVTGLSVNVDYEVQKGLFWRTEYRAFLGQNEVFPESKPGNFSSHDSFIVTSLSYSFDVGEIKW